MVTRMGLALVMACSFITTRGAAQPGLHLATLRSAEPHEFDAYGSCVAARNGALIVADTGFDPQPGQGESGGAWLTRGSTTTHIMNPSPNAAERFGDAIWIGASGMMIGAWRDDDLGTDSGRAHLFDHSGNLIRSFPNPNPDPDDRFGKAVAMAGENVLVSAYKDNLFAPLGGVAYLFDQAGNVLQTLRDPTPNSGDRFGFTVAGWRDQSLVGAYRESNLGASNSGAVYRFGPSGELAWTFNNPRPGPGDLFGHAMAAGRDRLAVAATEDDSLGLDAGAVYVFDLSDGELLYEIANPSPDPLDEFGWSLAWIGDCLAVGAPNDDYMGLQDAGVAYLFGPQGELLCTLPNPEPTAADAFGGCLGATDRYLYVGAPGDDSMGDGSGSVYVFSTPRELAAPWGTGGENPNNAPRMERSAVPEPHSCGLFLVAGAGLVGLIATRRRFRCVTLDAPPHRGE